MNKLNVCNRKFFNENQSKQVGRIVKPGNSQSSWKTVKIAKAAKISKLFKEGVDFKYKLLPDTFASHFD
jgi:hypothetical protein